MTTPASPLETGQRVRVSELAENPLEGVEQFLYLEDQPPPDTAALGPKDVLIRVRSAAVGWVDLLMLSGQGIYRLEDSYYPVEAGDAIWMAPYCPQWFAAIGDIPASYLYYKDIHRLP